MKPNDYKQRDAEFKNLCAEREMAWDLAMNDKGATLRRNERNWDRFYEKWYGRPSKTQKTLDTFKRKTISRTKASHKVTKSNKRNVK